MADYSVSINLVANDNASQAVQDLNKALQGVGETTEKQKNDSAAQVSAWDNYKNAIGTVTTAIGTAQMAVDMLGAALEVSDWGENVHAVGAAFQALQGDAQTAANTLQTVRDATSGVISDMDIESAVNRMQSMGLADTANEFGELIGMAQQLGSVMSPGATAAQNIDNFTLLLANQSVRRLDSFGISADAVRQRIEELKEAGYSAQEAFNMATLEQGRIALANLGDAATVGATNVDRLSTRWDNFFNTFSEGVAGFVNEAAFTADAIIQIHDATVDSNAAIVEQNDAIEANREAYQEWASQQGNQIVGGANPQSDTGNVGYQQWLNNQSQAGNQYGSQEQADYAMMQFAGGIMDLDMSGLVADADAFAAGVIDVTTQTMAAKDAAKDLEDQWGLVAGAISNEAGLNAAILEAKDNTKVLQDGWDALHGSVSANADEAARMADAAERAEISLSGALGTTNGGMGGEVGSDVASQMQASGMSQADIDAYNQATGLMTGQVTQSSMAYDQQVVPMITNIYNQFGAEAAAQATMNVTTGMQNAEMMGLTDEQTAAAMGGMTGYTETAASAGGFQGLGTTAQGTTLSQTEGFDITAYTDGLSEVDSTMSTIADSGDKFQSSMQESVTSVNQIESGVSRMGNSLARTVTQFQSLGNTRVTMPINVDLRFDENGPLAAYIRSVVAGSNSDGETIPGTGAGQ